MIFTRMEHETALFDLKILCLLMSCSDLLPHEANAILGHLPGRVCWAFQGPDPEVGVLKCIWCIVYSTCAIYLLQAEVKTDSKETKARDGHRLQRWSAWL